MNTTHSTSENEEEGYSVIGGPRFAGKKQDESTVIVLNRGSKIHNTELFRSLSEMDFSEILSVEGPTPSYDTESRTRVFPKLRVLQTYVSQPAGTLVNMAMQESSGAYALVIWNDMQPGSLVQYRDMRKPEGKTERTEQAGPENEKHILCTVPVLLNRQGDNIPVLKAPAFYRGSNLRIVSLPLTGKHSPTLYPFDYVGWYRKENFQFLGGFDPRIANSYWQKLDFGFRAFLWGERILLSSRWKLQYERDPEPEDTTPDESYRYFYLKNLALRFEGDSGNLPVSRFFPFLFRSGTGFFDSLRVFQEIRSWVKENALRFRQDARSITELWDIEENL
ncbi:MAG: hypothetical protein K9L68_01475 [Spirochaetales bacterium]|nr:hypothetical protein [Spirochaetales bacterium]